IAALEQKTHAETPALDAWQMVQFLYPIAVKVENNRAIKEAQLRAEEEMEHLESLFKKASSLALTHSDENALALFRELLETKKEDYALSSEERVLAEQFTGDSVLQKFAEVADDATTAGRKKKYFDLLGVQWSAELSQWVIAAPTAGKDSKSEETKPPLLFEAGLTASLEVLWNLLNKNQLIDPDNAELEIPEDELSKNPFREYLVGRKKELIDDVEQFLRLSEGNERLGTSIAYGLPHLLDEWSKPTSIAAVATGLGVGYRVGMAIGARCGLTWWGGLAATAGEIVADGTLFTLTQKAGESALYSYEGQWLDAEGHFIVHKDLFANVLLSGLNRGGSVLVSQGSTRLAASKLGQVLGFGRPVAGSAEVIRTMAPNGRIVLVGNPAASGVPQLTPWGELVTAGFHHAGSFGLMYGGGKLVYKMGLSSEDPTVTKVGLMYVHGLTTGPIFHGTTAARAAAQREDLSQRRKALKAEKKAAKKNSTHQENLFGEANFHASPFWTRVGGMYLYGMMPGGSRGTALPHIDAWPEVIPNPKQNAKKSPPTPVSVFQGPDFDNLSFSSPAGKRVVSLEQPENREISILHQLANLSIRRPLNEEALKASDAKIDQFIEKVGDITLTRQEDGKILLHNSRDDVVQPTREDSNPSLLRTPLLRNGKQVLCDETVELKSGDVLKMGNVEIRVDAGITPLRKNFRRMQIPPEQQVVIANALSRAKNIPKLEEELQNVGGRAAAGAAEVLDLAQQVFSGKLPLEHLPQELNIRGSVQNLLEAEVARLRQEHPEVQAAAFELKDGPLHRDLSPLEMEFHRLREMRGFKARVQNAKDIPEFVEALGRPFAKIAGVEVEAQLQGLNRELLETAHRHIKSKVEEAEKNVRLLEEDYQKRESHSRKNPQAASDHGKEVAELKTSEAVLNQCRRDLELLKEQEHALEQRLQQTQSGSASAAGKVDLADFPIPLPVVRQKARDLHEQAEGRFAAGLDLQDKSALTALAKKYHFDSGNADDFNGIQSMIRLCFDDAGPSARAFLSRASSKDIDLLFKVYFGEAQERLLPAAKAQQLAFLFGQAGIKESLGLSLNNLEGDGRSLTLRRGNFEEQVKNIPDEALVFRTYPAAEQGKSPVVRTEEIEALIHQAQQFQSRIDSQAQQFQSQRDIKTMKMFHGQMKGSSLFFNPVKGVFEAWSLRPECLIKIEVTLTDSNEVVDVRVKYAPQPGRSGKKAELEDDNFIQRQNDDGSLELGTVALQEIGLKDLTKELPFPILQTSSWEKVGDARARSFDLLARGARRAGRGTAHAASYAAQAVGKVVDKVRGKSP
ncbi:MAG TPA: hypothetical protein DF383_10070, partial [Deltaproteobacteria bacterium]|nr:hypothetical protein [Deltaproteobacteria bacterium]